MQTLDDRPETIHLYVVREEASHPQILPIFLSAFALSFLVAFCALTPYQQPVMRTTIRVPAVPLSLKTFTVNVTIIPTGIKTYPATTAHGVLTITNGSIIGQSIPAGFTIQGVQTDSAVYVPPGNANGYGWAEVQAHAVISGRNGNYAAFAINSVIGSSVYIRNLSAFYGGRDAYSVKFVTPQDKQTALATARNQLAVQPVGLHYPCSESWSGIFRSIELIWHCQFLTYSAPSFLHVTSVKLSGKEVLISGWFTEPMKRFWVK
jgi:hypothetical protein